MSGNLSLYSEYFSPGAGSNVHKTYFYFLKLTSILFYLLRSKKLNIKWKIYTCKTYSKLKCKSPKIKTFLFTLPKKQPKTIFPNDFSSEIDTFGNTLSQDALHHRFNLCHR